MSHTFKLSELSEKSYRKFNVVGMIFIMHKFMWITEDVNVIYALYARYEINIRQAPKVDKVSVCWGLLRKISKI